MLIINDPNFFCRRHKNKSSLSAGLPPPPPPPSLPFTLSQIEYAPPPPTHTHTRRSHRCIYSELTKNQIRSWVFAVYVELRGNKLTVHVGVFFLTFTHKLTHFPHLRICDEQNDLSVVTYKQYGKRNVPLAFLHGQNNQNTDSFFFKQRENFATLFKV